MRDREDGRAAAAKTRAADREGRLQECLMVMGFLIFGAGIAFIYWPAALVACGGLLMWFAFPKGAGLRKNRV